SGLAIGDELPDLLLQHRQWHRALGQHRIVEGANVEIRAEFALGFRAQGDDADLAQLVAERLARPGDVAIHFGGYLVFAERGVVAQIGERLVATPSLAVYAGIDDQPARPPHFIAEPAEMLVRCRVDAHLDAELFRIQSPAFAVGGNVAIATEFGLPGLLLDRKSVV